MEIKEKYTFLDLFIDNGYVLDFSTDGFDAFTYKSIGIPLCAKYHLSKGKSLTQFVNDASDDSVIKIFGDLLQYFDAKYRKGSKLENTERERQYQECCKILQKYNNPTLIEVPAIKSVNREYIKSISNRALLDLDSGHFDSAITKARTLLEEVFCFVIEKSGSIPDGSGNIKTLYAQVKKLHNMHSDKNVDGRINTLLSGLEKILTAIAEMRNESSDAHGVGMKRIKIHDYHARLFVTSAQVMADFILSVHKHKFSQ